MNKLLKLFILVFSVSACQAQDQNILLDKKLITNWADYPVYDYLTETQDGQTVWKTEFAYLDSINVYWITYLSDGLKIKGMLVEPKDSTQTYPCIIYNRGGNRDFGSLIVAHGAITLGRLAKEGYVVIASNYRGNGGSEGEEEFGGSDVNDVISLIAALNDVPIADTQRIGMYGWSRGGMMTYIALTKTDKIKAAAVGGAVSDNFASIVDRPEMERDVLAQLIPNYEQLKEEELTKRSALFWADKFSKDVPILLLHGNADWRVKPEQSLKMALEFEKYRVPYRLIMFEGADHGISEHKEEVNEQVIHWFNRFLKNGERVPNMEYHGD